MICADIWIGCKDNTLGALREAVAELEQLGVKEETPILDGGHMYYDPEGPLAAFCDDPDVPRVEDLFRFIAAHEELSDDAVINHAALLVVDVQSLSCEPILCGEHVLGEDPEPTDILVTLHQCES